MVFYKEFQHLLLRGDEDPHEEHEGCDRIDADVVDRRHVVLDELQHGLCAIGPAPPGWQAVV